MDENGIALNKALGTELDFIFNYSLSKIVNIEGGYSTMFSSATMTSPKVKNIKNGDTLSTWAYLMISIKPDFLVK